MANIEIRPNKVFVIEYETYRYVHQHRLSLDEMLLGVSNAYARLVKENYVPRDEEIEECQAKMWGMKGE